MKYFPEFYRILERFHEPRLETVDREFRAKKKSREYQLYEGIGNGTFQTDTAAAGTLYEAAKPDAPKYRSLKNRLKVRMLNSLFHLNLKRAGFSDAAQAFYIAHRRVFMVKILFGMGAERSAVRMAETTLDLAKQFELTDVALDMSRLLRESASNAGRTKRFEYYNQYVREFEKKYIAELRAIEYFERIVMILNRKARVYSQHAKEFEGYVSELKGLMSSADSFNFQLHYHRVRALAGYTSENPFEVIEASQAGLQFLDSRPDLLQRERKGDFWLYQFQSYLRIQLFAEAQAASHACASYYNTGSNNWFLYAWTQFLLLMNTLQIREAYDFFTEVTSHSRFPHQSEMTRQHWEIFKFYLVYAMRSLPDYDANAHPLRLNYEGLLKNFDARRDKEGMNMLIRFAQVLYLVETRDYDTMDNVIRDIYTYRAKHIVAAKTEQTTIFMQLLRMMVRNSYSYRYCLANGREKFEKLKNGKFEVIDLDQEIQVLPYTWLWERLLERMKANENLAAAKYR